MRHPLQSVIEELHVELGYDAERIAKAIELPVSEVQEALDGLAKRRRRGAFFVAVIGDGGPERRGPGGAVSLAADGSSVWHAPRGFGRGR